MKRISGTIPVKLVIFLLVAVLLAGSAAWAKPTSPDQAKTVVLNWLGLDAAPLGAPLGAQIKAGKTFNQPAADTWSGVDKAPQAASPGPQIKEVKTYYYQGTPVYYVVYLNPAGLVFLPADDLVEPIIGFLPEGLYDPSPTNPLGALVSRDIPGRVLQAREVEAKGLAPLAPEAPQAVAQRKWAWLENPGAGTASEAAEFGLPSISNVWVTPLVQSKWDQSTVGGQNCYNYYTPYSPSESTNHVCGCVATAMAQLMRFWSFPTTGVGTGSYAITVDGVATSANLRGGNNSGGAYNWGQMELDPLHPVSPPLTLTQRQAIGALTSDAGLSVNMDYETTALGGAGSDTCAASAAFVNTFHYSNAKNAYSGSSSSSIPAANRNNMLNPNLDAGYPTLLGIRGSVGGHAIVCDGYGYNSTTLYHHLNMGWSGSDNAWYALPIIDTSWTTFDVQYKIIYNVYKTGTGEIISGRVTTSGGTAISGATVSATGGYSTTTNANGIYALPKVPSGSSYTVSVTKTGYSFTSQAVTTGTSADFTTTTGNKWGINFVAGGTPPTPSGRVLFNNGPLVNSPGTGAGGADESVLQNSSLGMTTFGLGNQVVNGYRVADDFKLTSRSQLQKIKFYAYQSGSTTTSTITAVNLRIWNGPPNNSGSTVIYGDTTTNRMANTTWANIYRVDEATHGATTRPVMICTASVDVTLNPGTYWLDWQMDGSLSSGPWAPPITKNGQTTTGNALQYTTSWAAALDGGTSTQQGFPFIIEGLGGANVSPMNMLLLN
ncbi:MAG: C10 family peptidase [Deltaproteobacteria bacterium]|nr:C10 family peptidase [Deltaproteobacteria bacterium]